MPETWKPRVDHSRETHVRSLLSKKKNREINPNKTIPPYEAKVASAATFVACISVSKSGRDAVHLEAVLSRRSRMHTEYVQEVAEKRNGLPNWIEDPTPFNQLGNTRCGNKASLLYAGGIFLARLCRRCRFS